MSIDLFPNLSQAADEQIYLYKTDQLMYNSGMNVFFLYGTDTDAAAMKKAAEAAGHNVCGLYSPNYKEKLFEARILVVFFDSPSSLNDKTIEECWQYYLNELAWKRKLQGDIVLVLGNGIEKNRLAFKLKRFPSVQNTDYNGLEKLFDTLTKTPEFNPALDAIKLPGPIEFKHDHYESNYNPYEESEEKEKKPVIETTRQKPVHSKPEYKKPAKTAIKATEKVKIAFDYIWLILLIPFSVLVMFGLSMFSQNVISNNVNPYINILIAFLAVLILAPAFNMPFYYSRKAAKASRFVKIAAIIICFAFDIIFQNLRAVSGGAPFMFIPVLNGPDLYGLFYVIGYAFITLLAFIISKLRILGKKFGGVNLILIYIACHAYDGIPLRFGVPFIFMFLALIPIIFFCRFLTRIIFKKRTLRIIYKVLGFTVAIILAAYAVYSSFTVFNLHLL